MSFQGVRRRYSDFEWLRNVLLARYHGAPSFDPVAMSPQTSHLLSSLLLPPLLFLLTAGIALPQLPEKRIMNQGKEFIEGRRRDLQTFMNELTNNPYMHEVQR